METKTKKLTLNVTDTSIITPELVEWLDAMFDYNSAYAMRDTLWEIYHSYLIHECKALPEVFSEMADHLYWLDGLLKLIAEQRQEVKDLRDAIMTGKGGGVS